MTGDNVSFADLVQTLYELCMANESGTFRIVSTLNHSAAFTLETGEIIGVRYRNVRGFKAIDKIRSIQEARYTFDKQSHRASDSFLPPTETILANLGFTAPPITIPSQTKEQKKQLPSELKMLLQTSLADQIGPAADLIAPQIYAQTQELSEVIRLMVAQIPDSRHAKQFIELLKEQLDPNTNSE